MLGGRRVRQVGATYGSSEAHKGRLADIICDGWAIPADRVAQASAIVR